MAGVIGSLVAISCHFVSTDFWPFSGSKFLLTMKKITHVSQPSTSATAFSRECQI